jgi:hypothetical protein
MTYLPPFALFGARTAVEDGRISRHVAPGCGCWRPCATGAWTSTARALPQLNATSTPSSPPRAGRAEPWTASCSRPSSILCAAVIAVPIAKRLGLGSVLGYLIAGIVIGPVIGLVGSETERCSTSPSSAW